MIKQIFMCKFIENNWGIETCTVYIDCMKSCNQVLTKRSLNNSYSNQWWYQMVCGKLYSWRLNNLYVWLCIKKELTLFVQIHTTLLLDNDCSYMNETNGNSLMWVLSNQDKLWLGGTTRKMLQEEKAICQDTSSHPSIGTLEKVSVWRCVTLD